MSNRIVVFTGNLAYSVRKGIIEIDDARLGLKWLIVEQTPPRSVRRLVRNQWLNLRRNGWRWIPYQVGDIVRRLIERPQPTTSAAAPGRAYSLEALAERPHVRILCTPDLHADDVLSRVCEFAPDIGLSLAAPILSRSLFSIPRFGTINLHKGRLPDFRGMPPAFWELWHEEREVGCSVHQVDDKLDTGAILARAVVPRGRYASLRGLQLQLDEAGIDLMNRATFDMLDGTARPIAQPGGGRTFRKPTLKQQADLAQRLSRQQPRPRPPILTRKRTAARRFLDPLVGRTTYVVGLGALSLAKDAWATLQWTAWQGVLRHVLPPRVTVLLFHRVSDDARDNLTVGIEQFDRQMTLLTKRCHVVPLAELLSWETVPRGRRPVVAVTFDDGYLDNFTNAAPILLRHGVPAAFFVSTGIVGTERPFPHDVRRGNRGLPNMSWDDLRRMRAWGFEVGSHSVTHLDCAAEPAQCVISELEASRTALASELGDSAWVFAYPYGGRQHMTADRLELVKSAGYIGCLSAYGGTNIRHVDRFNVLRRGVNWEFSDAGFLKQCLGL